ncbi:MAG: TlpA family protein disulfide reductase [Mycobacteriaceae bacterium]|nr:TlpA family protein disulfide reductase [Mycobacteriaceae bacterium]
MKASTRRRTGWTVVVLAVVALLIAALVTQLRDPSPGSTETLRDITDREHREVDTAAALAAPRRQANLPPCPAADGAETAPRPTALQAVLVECAADGSTVDARQALRGHPVVLNFWAYWCAPCAAELPALAEYQRRVGSAVLVVTVHQDENEAAALLRLAQLGVRLPTWQDGRRRVAAALRVPNVMPTTVVLYPDGSVAQTLPRAFTSAEEITAAIGSAWQ